MAERPVRVGVAGAGWWAVTNHLPILEREDGAVIAAVNRLGCDELAAVKATFGAEFATEDFDEMIAEADLDAAIIATPHNLHHAQACTALNAGLHVMVEKPMTASAAEARELVDLASAKKRHLMVPYGWNFRPFTERCREIVAGGGIGEIRHVAAQMASPAGDLFTGRDFAGTENDMFRPEPKNWANAEFGGYGWGQLVHLLGALFFLTDLQPVEVTAVIGKSALGADIYNAATVRFGSGATASLSGAATVPHGSPFQLDLRLFGTEGMLLLDMERERAWLRRNDGADEDVAMAPGDGAYVCAEPVRRFIALCQGKPVANNGGGEVGRKSVAVVEAMLRAAAAGTAIGVAA